MKLRTGMLVIAVVAIAGCASNVPLTITGVDTNVVADRPAAATVDVGIHWGWRIVGDAAVRPIQVFDMNGKTYLQMQDQRSVVLMVNGQVVPFQVSLPYLVVQGVPTVIDVVRDGYRAVLARSADTSATQASGGVVPLKSAPSVGRVHRAVVGQAAAPVVVQPVQVIPAAAVPALEAAPAPVPDSSIKRTGRIKRMEVQ